MITFLVQVLNAPVHEVLHIIGEVGLKAPAGPFSGLSFGVAPVTRALLSPKVWVDARHTACTTPLLIVNAYFAERARFLSISHHPLVALSNCSRFMVGSHRPGILIIKVGSTIPGARGASRMLIATSVAHTSPEANMVPGDDIVEFYPEPLKQLDRGRLDGEGCSVRQPEPQEFVSDFLPFTTNRANPVELRIHGCLVQGGFGVLENTVALSFSNIEYLVVARVRKQVYVARQALHHHWRKLAELSTSGFGVADRGSGTGVDFSRVVTGCMSLSLRDAVITG